MKTKIISGMLLLTLFAQAQEVKKTSLDNPFFQPYKTPFEVPPFDLIKEEHFKPAMVKGMEEQQKEIDAIVKNKAVPTFQNTILAMENSGKLLSKASTVFSNLNSANTNDEIQKISPLLGNGNKKKRNELLHTAVYEPFAQYKGPL